MSTRSDDQTAEEAFAAAFRNRRRFLGLSQTQVAELATELDLPMQQQTITKIENNTRPIRLDEAEVLARVLGTTLEELRRPAPALSERQLRRELATVRRELARLEAERVEAETAFVEAEARLRQVKADLHARRSTERAMAELLEGD